MKNWMLFNLVGRPVAALTPTAMHKLRPHLTKQPYGYSVDRDMQFEGVDINLFVWKDMTVEQVEVER